MLKNLFTSYLRDSHPAYGSGGYIIRLLRRKDVKIIFTGFILLLLIANMWTNRATAVQSETYDLKMKHFKELNAKRKAIESTLLTHTSPSDDYSVAVITNNTGMQLYGSKKPYEAASISKLVTAAAILHKVDNKQLELQDNVHGQSVFSWLDKMVVASDYEAWHHLNRAVSHDYLVSYAEQLNMRSFNPYANRITAADTATLLTQLYGSDALKQRHQRMLLGMMSRSNYRDHIVAAVPAGYSVMHKVGLSEGNYHDAAIISSGKSWLVLVIFSNDHGHADPSKRKLVFQSLTRSAINTYLKH